MDSLGGDIQEKSFDILKNGDRLASIVAPPNEDLAKLNGVKVSFVWLEPDRKPLDQIRELIEEGKVKPHVGYTFEFSEEGLRKAHELSESHHARGKIVIPIKS
ncbi:zinc-binding dehydrogenase [Pseudalkalibacillus sp. A8]|uniref:zinc-binding dehydrogenase n=1 Tax=Pseudalkalibacillus sp. A8 TaxID=3382641 RepID=UPI0038B55770